MAGEIKTNKNTYIYGLLVLSLIIAIAVSLLLIRPLLADNKNKQAIIDKKNKNLKILEEKRSKLEEFSFKSTEIKEKSDLVRKAVPDKSEDERFYFQTEMIAQNSGVLVNSIDIDPNVQITEYDESGNPIDNQTSGFTSRTFTASITCNYKSLLQFIASMKDALRLVSVEKFDIRIKDAETGVLDVNITMTSYLNSQGGESE